MTILELIYRRRSIRRFQNTRIPFDHLQSIVDAGRVAPSASNIQPLEYIIVDDSQLVSTVFGFTNWAGYLSPEQGRPPAGAEPTAFIAVLVNMDIANNWVSHDVGAAVENMILTALEKGIGTCWIGSVKRDEIQRGLRVPKNYRIDSLLALGYPDEEPVIEEMFDSVRYYKDDSGVLHVPKRHLKSILHHNEF